MVSDLKRVLNQKFVDEKVSEPFTLDGIADTENDDLQVLFGFRFIARIVLTHR